MTMGKLALISAAAAAMLWGATLGPAAAMPITGSAVAPAFDNVDSLAAAGCYRFGERGYRWYSFCAGPSWLYPHRRVCRKGRCWYE
jgi:hypothetical protein